MRGEALTSGDRSLLSLPPLPRRHRRPPLFEGVPRLEGLSFV
jgi:hypothetical protein